MLMRIAKAQYMVYNDTDCNKMMCCNPYFCVIKLEMGIMLGEYYADIRYEWVDFTPFHSYLYVKWCPLSV